MSESQASNKKFNNKPISSSNSSNGDEELNSLVPDATNRIVKAAESNDNDDYHDANDTSDQNRELDSAAAESPSTAVTNRAINNSSPQVIVNERVIQQIVIKDKSIEGTILPTLIGSSKKANSLDTGSKTESNSSINSRAVPITTTKTNFLTVDYKSKPLIQQQQTTPTTAHIKTKKSASEHDMNTSSSSSLSSNDEKRAAPKANESRRPSIFDFVDEDETFEDVGLINKSASDSKFDALNRRFSASPSPSPSQNNQEPARVSSIASGGLKKPLSFLSTVSLTSNTDTDHLSAIPLVKITASSDDPLAHSYNDDGNDGLNAKDTLKNSKNHSIMNEVDETTSKAGTRAATGATSNNRYILASPSSHGEKRVEFELGSRTIPTKSSLKRPKSALKRFNIETNSLMSQNVDEKEELELADKSKNRKQQQQHQQQHQDPPSSSLNSNGGGSGSGDSGGKLTSRNTTSGSFSATTSGHISRSGGERKLSNYETGKSTAGKPSRPDELLSLLVNETQSTSAGGQSKQKKDKLDTKLDETQLDQVVSSFNKDTNNSGTNNEKQMWNLPSFNETTSFTTQTSTDPERQTNARQGKFLKQKNGKKHTPLHTRIKNESSCQPHDLFIELKLLQPSTDANNNISNAAASANNNSGVYTTNSEIKDDEVNYEWKQVSRWIKYEQNLDLETNMWSNPYVGALVYQSLLYLKTGLQYGTVLLNSDHDSFTGIVDEMIQDFIDSGHMNKENKYLVKRTLLSNHKHDSSNTGGFMRKKSTISDFFPGSRRPSSFNSEQAYQSENNSSSVSRKNSSAQFSDTNSQREKKAANMDSKLSNSEIHLERGTARIHRDSSVKFLAKSNTDGASSGAAGPHNSIETNINQPSAPPAAANRGRRRSTIVFLKNTLNQSKLNKSELSLRGLASDAEAFVCMIGVVDFLDRPIMAFVRLTNSQYIDEMVQVQLKVRFIFVLLGPKNDNIDYVEIGRCIGTLMTNKEFHDCAYRANDRRELIENITSFANRSLCLVLPVGVFDDDLLKPIIEWMQNKMKKKTSKSISETKIYDKNSPTSSLMNKLSIRDTLVSVDDNKLVSSNGGGDGGDDEFNPFQRTGCLFGSLIKEIKYRYSYYISDITDALNLHCLIALIFTFTVCVAPALSFGGILADKTDKTFGINEMLLATSINGIISGLFSGQPLMILGSTGPFLVFEEMLYNFCKEKFCIEFLATRCWVAMWVLFLTLVMVAFEGVYIINYVTRFTEEIFAFLIASVFLADAAKKIYRIFQKDPIYTAEKYCQINNQTYFSPFMNMSNQSSSSSSIYNGYSFVECPMYDDGTHGISNNAIEPNIALLSLILLIGTCVMALTLKKLRRSIFFGAYVRRTLSDVGMLISIILMVVVDYFIQDKTGVITEKLIIPDSLVPTKFREFWLVSPFGHNYNNSNYLPLWVPFAALFPALLVFVVLFFEVELTGMILYSKQRKLKKGTGFNLDLLIGAIMITLNSFFGLPWMCAAPVRTLAHWASLSVYSTTYVPGEKPRLIEVKEQRLTHILVHLSIGFCLLAKSAIKMIPISVLFGIFLYFGIVSLSGTQLYERIKLVFIPSKYCPNHVYARGVRPSKRNLFTLIQILFVVILLALKSFTKFSYVFPIILVLLVPLRTFIMPKVFTNKELEQLDHDKDMNLNDEMGLDFYELTHLPI